MSALPRRPRGRPADEALRGRRHEEILDMAARVFAERGYRTTDLQVVADALAIGKGTIYRYFPSKEALFLAAVDSGMRRLHEAIEEARQGADDPLDRSEQIIHAYLAFFRDNPHYVELIIQERAELKDRPKQTYFVHQEAHIQEWHEIFRRLIAEGRVRDRPVERMVAVMSNLVYGTMFTNYYTGRHLSLDEQARDLIDLIFNGILTESEQRRRGAGRAADNPS
jgi:AcrR family transcriptional regulator